MYLEGELNKASRESLGKKKFLPSNVQWKKEKALGNSCFYITRKKLSGRESEEKGENLCQEVSEECADKNIY